MDGTPLEDITQKLKAFVFVTPPPKKNQGSPFVKITLIKNPRIENIAVQNSRVCGL